MELYGEQVTRANLEMRNDVETIRKHDPQAILIVAGDHGPRRTKNCGSTEGKYDISEISRLDLQDRYGAFLAIRWPSEDYELYDDITILQDLFPAILAYMFEDPGLLQARPEPVTGDEALASGARIDHGMIVGGLDDGEPLFMDVVEE
jgi:hypothetical protein